MKTTITLEKETATELNLMKYALAVDTLDEVVSKLILNYKIFKELRENKNEQ